MPFCVNCGVELSKSEKYCPLCNVEVINPKSPWQESAERPYPNHVEVLMKRLDRRYFATLVGLVLLIPIIVTIIFDFLPGDGITWSAYVVGALALLFIFFAFPFYFKRFHPVIFLSIDCAAALLYLFFIESMNGGHWFMGLGLPLAVATSIFVIVLAFLFTRKKRMKLLFRAALAFFASGIFILCIELIISMNFLGEFRLEWSFYAFVPLVVLSVAAFVLDHRKNLKEEIRRRLFYK